MKLLLWLLLGLLIYWALRSQIKRNQNRRNQSPFEGNSMRSSAPPKSAAPVENMVACAYCQLYLPASDAIRSADSTTEHYFCSAEHAKLYSDSAKKTHAE
jgi:uncharacterized protein